MDIRLCALPSVTPDTEQNRILKPGILPISIIKTLKKEIPTITKSEDTSTSVTKSFTVTGPGRRGEHFNVILQPACESTPAVFLAVSTVMW